jgi:hypothetical protein
MLIKDMFQNKQWSNVIKLNSIMGAKRNGSEWKFEISVVDQSVSLSCINNMTICHPRFVNYLPFTIPGDLRCQVRSHLIFALSRHMEFPCIAPSYQSFSGLMLGYTLYSTPATIGNVPGGLEFQRTASLSLSEIKWPMNWDWMCAISVHKFSLLRFA